MRFLRRKLGLGEHEGVFCYVNSVFAPGLDEGVGNLWRVSFFLFIVLFLFCFVILVLPSMCLHLIVRVFICLHAACGLVGRLDRPTD